MSLEFTENKSNIGSGALNDLMFILYCRVIGQRLPTRRRSVGDQLGSDREPIGDRSATGWRLYLERLFLIAESLQLFGDRSATDRRLVGDQSATKICVGIVCNRCNWSAISHQPVGNLSATTKNLSTIDLVAERFYLQQPKPPCDQIVPATICNRSPTSRRPPCNHPATSLRPPEIFVARRSPTGCKLCVTGALLAIFAGNSLVPGKFPAQRPVTRSFDDFLDLRLNKRLSKQPWSWRFKTPACSLWRHCNGYRKRIVSENQVNSSAAYALTCMRPGLPRNSHVKIHIS